MMIKTLAAQVKEYKKASIMTPVFMILEVIFETLIPFLMASIIDDGVEAGNIRHIYAVGAAMIVMALCGLFCGTMGGKYGARASTGFAKNLRQAMFENIQTFSFASLDKFSTAGLVTRLTTDVTNMQMAYQMILRICFRGARQYDLCYDNGFSDQCKTCECLSDSGACAWRGSVSYYPGRQYIF